MAVGGKQAQSTQSKDQGPAMPGKYKQPFYKEDDAATASINDSPQRQSLAAQLFKV